ncbi:hypothetical protein Y032_0329g2659 [Ancylostoma ceylanicum]|uniref:Uncharacterized protein n=1 Tax=Ancylostoma ceylanicum TaxID=53326 RepID=A0A016RZR1_9BILA|nr:hypothetical protein Y032_0329g2659 [Ancylostoma ceylanicum]
MIFQDTAASQPLARVKRNLSGRIRQLKRQRNTIRRRAKKRARQLKGQRDRLYRRFRRYKQKYPPTTG